MGADMQPVFDIVTLGHLLQAEVQAMIADLSQQWLVPPLGTMEVSPEGGLQALYALEKESQHFWAPLLQLLNLDAYLTSGFFPTNLAQAETVPQTARTVERRPSPLLFFGNSEELSANEVSSHLPTSTDLTVPGRSAVRSGDLPSSDVPATASPGQVSDMPDVGGRGHIQAAGVLLANTPARLPFQSSTASPTVPPRQEAKGNDVLPGAAGRHPAAYNDVLSGMPVRPQAAASDLWPSISSGQPVATDSVSRASSSHSRPSAGRPQSSGQADPTPTLLDTTIQPRRRSSRSLPGDPNGTTQLPNRPLPNAPAHAETGQTTDKVDAPALLRRTSQQMAPPPGGVAQDNDEMMGSWVTAPGTAQSLLPQPGYPVKSRLSAADPLQLAVALAQPPEKLPPFQVVEPSPVYRSITGGLQAFAQQIQVTTVDESFSAFAPLTPQTEAHPLMALVGQKSAPDWLDTAHTAFRQVGTELAEVFDTQPAPAWKSAAAEQSVQTLLTEIEASPQVVAAEEWPLHPEMHRSAGRVADLSAPSHPPNTRAQLMVGTRPQEALTADQLDTIVDALSRSIERDYHRFYGA